MSTSENNYDIKKLYLGGFEVWSYDDAEIIEKIIIDSINGSEGVWVYRHHAHLLEENDLIKWLKNNPRMVSYREVSLQFIEDNVTENFKSKNNEMIYFLRFDQESKENFLKHFRISIRDIKNRIGRKNISKWLEKRIYIDDPLYDQYDFIFTVGDQVIAFTDIHDFTFIKGENLDGHMG